jgi:uncharacterized membrane protein
VYFTRKARIITSKRLKNYDTLCQILNVYYSAVLVALSIWSIVFASDLRLVSFLILVFSLAQTMFSIFYSSRNFQERYTNIKSHYINLDKFYNKITQITNNEFEDKNIRLQIFEEYSDLLEMVENHSDFDYLTSRMYSDERVLIQRKTKFYFYFIRVLKCILTTILFLAPILLICLLISISEKLGFKNII